MNLPKRYVAWLTINRTCNLRCKWCYAADTNFQGQMTTETFNKTLGLMDNIPIKNVMLIGGEPTIHTNFLGMVETLSRKYTVFVVSNSIKFADENFLQSAINMGMKAVTTSLKAPDADGYKLATGVDVFDRVLKAIDNLEKAKNPNFFHKVSLILCGRMFRYFERTFNAIVESGVEYVAFDTEKPTIVDGKTKFDGECTPQEMADFIVRIYPIVAKSKLKFNFKITIPFCLFPPGFIDELRIKNQMSSGCQILNGSGFVVDVDGNLLPCNHFCSHPLGNIEECSNGFQAWRGQERVVKFYDKLANYPAKQCQECSQWKYCGAGCRIHWLNMGVEMLPKPVKVTNTYE